MTNGAGADGARNAVVITGAASGIGRASAIRLANAGWAVSILDINAEAAGRLATELTQAGLPALAFGCDVTSKDAMRHAVAETEHRFGTVNAAVACAADQDTVGTVLETDEDAWRRAVDITLNGTYMLARAVLPHLIATRGAFVAVSSVAGIRPARDLAVYNAAKAGVVALVRSMALDHGPAGVRSNALCPGETITPAHDRSLGQMTEDQRRALLAAHPLGRFATADEMAAAVAHLVGDEASFTNGHVYVADGGLTAGSFSLSFGAQG
ncbi:MAG TPA: SDR family oxidoreductase [Baekduia sp.]|uniref:SDR family NAD(P)-dependent oxidoreductase n=1 Tax=Baekduia sp. TaxID=2600305 RepID=UPI002D768F84|nr:SDR family oxidoreductase [Baekduia sp.]HET6509085.1 SDR family oxidoreductase [Baekduia sp.]